MPTSMGGSILDGPARDAVVLLTIKPCPMSFPFTP